MSGNLQLNTMMKLLTILDSRLRGNDTFFQSVPSLPVIPAKAGIQELIDNLGIVDKQIGKFYFLLRIMSIMFDDEWSLGSPTMAVSPPYESTVSRSRIVSLL